MVRSLWSESDEGAVTQPESASLRLFLRYPEPFSSPYAFHSLVDHLPTEFFQQRSDPPIPVPPVPGCGVDDVGPRSFLIAPWASAALTSRNLLLICSGVYFLRAISPVSPIPEL